MKKKYDKVDSGLLLTYAGGTQRVISNYGNKKCLNSVTMNSFMTFTVVLGRLLNHSVIVYCNSLLAEVSHDEAKMGPLLAGKYCKIVK